MSSLGWRTSRASNSDACRVSQCQARARHSNFPAAHFRPTINEEQSVWLSSADQSLWSGQPSRKVLSSGRVGGRMMKHRLSITAIALLPMTAFSQGAYADPQYTGVFVARVGASTTDTALERQRSTIRSRSRLLGLGGSSTGYTLMGDRSPVRFRSGTAISLIVRVPAGGQSPDDAFRVFQVVPNRGMREFGGMRQGGLASLIPGGGPRNRQLTPVNFTVQSYRADVVRLVLPENLAPGEYCASAYAIAQTSGVFLATETPTVYCFGID
jgi:hypothetical protein